MAEPARPGGAALCAAGQAGVAFEQLQSAWPSERTLQRGERHVFVDKPAGVACRHASADEAGGPDLCQRLAQQGLEGLQPELELPLRASGVTWLTAGRGATPAAGGRVERITYVIGNDALPGAAEGTLRAARPAASGLLEYRVRRRHGARCLVEVQSDEPPESVMRTWAAAGQRIAGDAEAGAGGSGTRSLLHVERVRGPGLDVLARLPAEFESWLCGAAQRPPSELEAALRESVAVRYPLWRDHEAFRLLGEDAGEISGLTLERYGAHALLELSTEEAWRERERLAECVMDHGALGVYVKQRVRADLRKRDPLELAPPLPLRGAAAADPLRVRQAAASFWVRLGDGLATGLFLDQRSNWERVRQAARGAALLNLFSYTGAFSIAAAVGGAAACVSVDLSKRALSRLHANLELNGLAGPVHRLLASDVQRWLARAARAAQRFDWIVLDPPSFGTRPGGVLRADRDYADLVAGALQLLAPGGRLLCVSHQLGFHEQDLRALLRAAFAASGQAGSLETWVGGWDAATLPGVSTVKSVLARVQE